ncbi:trans-sialidase, putative, partial [Trypanosoma cruzi marinkellei]
MGAKMNGEQSNFFGLSYEKGKWKLLCGSEPDSREQIRASETEKTPHVVIVRRNGTQGSAYVDGQPVGGDAPCALETADSKGISHFYIGGDADGAGIQGVSVTVANVLLYNRPLNATEITALNNNKPSVPKPDVGKELAEVTPSPEGRAPAPRGTVAQPIVDEPQPKAPESLKRSEDAISAGAVAAAESTANNSPAGGGSVKQSASGTSSGGTQTVDGASLSDGDAAAGTGVGDTEPGDGPAVGPEARTGSGENGEGPGGTNGQEEGAESRDREVNATALSGN